MDDKPIINPRFYMDTGQLDFDIMTKANNFVDRIVSAEPMREIIYKRVFPPVGGENGKDDFADHVRDYSLTDWHRELPLTRISLSTLIITISNWNMLYGRPLGQGRRSR